MLIDQLTEFGEMGNKVRIGGSGPDAGKIAVERAYGPRPSTRSTGVKPRAAVGLPYGLAQGWHAGRYVQRFPTRHLGRSRELRYLGG